MVQGLFILFILNHIPIDHYILNNETDMFQKGYDLSKQNIDVTKLLFHLKWVLFL